MTPTQLKANRRTLAGSLGILGLLASLLLITLPSTPPPGNPSITCVFSGFMTGGGKFNSNINNAPSPAPLMPLVVHGFILHCDPSMLPNNLEINWKDPVT